MRYELHCFHIPKFRLMFPITYLYLSDTLTIYIYPGVPFSSPFPSLLSDTKPLYKVFPTPPQPPRNPRNTTHMNNMYGVRHVPPFSPPVSPHPRVYVRVWHTRGVAMTTGVKRVEAAAAIIPELHR